MAVRRLFPRRQEDPLIQQLLQKARQEAAKSSAIGSPQMYQAAAGGGIGPVAGVLTAQVLAGARSRNALQAAQLKQEQTNIASSKLAEVLANRQVDGKIMGADGRFYDRTITPREQVTGFNQNLLGQTERMPPPPAGQEYVTQESYYKPVGGEFYKTYRDAVATTTGEGTGAVIDSSVAQAMGTSTEDEAQNLAIALKAKQAREMTGTPPSDLEKELIQETMTPTTVDIPGTPKADNFFAKAANFLTGKQNVKDIKATDLFELASASGRSPLEVYNYLQTQKTGGKTTYTKPEQKNVTTTIDGKESTETATLRYKTTIDMNGNTEQTIEKRKDGVFVELLPNERISGSLKNNKLNEKNTATLKKLENSVVKDVDKRGQRVIFDKNNPSDISLLKLINNNPSLFRIGSMYSTSNLQKAEPLALKTNLTKKIGYIGTKKDLTIDNRMDQIITLDQDLKNDNGEVIVSKGTYNSIDNEDDFNLIKSLAEATSVSERNLDKRIVLKDSGAMKKLGEDLQQKRNSLKGIYRLVTKIDNSDVGFNRFFDDFKSKYNTLLASGLEPKEIALRAARGETQGLIGALRLDVLGPGVVTEQDALRLLAFIGGQAGAFENVAVFREQIKGILDVAEQNFLEDYDLYNKLKSENPERYKYTINIKDVTKDFEKRAFFDNTTIPDLSSGAIKNAKQGSAIWNRLSKLIEDNPNTYQNMMTPLQLEALEEMLQ